MADETNKLLLIIIAILLPPLAIFLVQNKFGTHFIINLVLCLFLWIPGILHAVYVVLQKPEA